MSFEARTDLALESGERIFKEPVEIHGVRIEEMESEYDDIKTTVVHIESENGSKAMGKPQGRYITIEAPDLLDGEDEYREQVAKEMARQLQCLISLEKDSAAIKIRFLPLKRPVYSFCIVQQFHRKEPHE